MHDYTLITALVVVLMLAFVLGFIAQRLKLSPIVGYLIAGIAVGPHTPGLVADAEVALQLAEIGVILLMFGVGLKFSLADLWAVRRVAIPGAVVQMAAATALGFGVGRVLGLGQNEALMLGFSLSVASTVVMLRSLEQRSLLKTDGGRICVGWLVVEDIAIVLAIVLLPTLAAVAASEAAPSTVETARALGVAAAKIAAFVLIMVFVGGRLFPWLIVRVAHLKSRELMALGTMSLALGVAYAAYAVFDASFALGAFLAGVALNGTRLTHKIAEDSQPLRDTFAVLFFVSVGMLFDPTALLAAPHHVGAIVAIIVVGKAIAALAIARLYGLPFATGILIAVALAQIGEFSFVLARLGVEHGLMSIETQNYVLAGALISIALNPLLFLIAAAAGPRGGVSRRAA